VDREEVKRNCRRIKGAEARQANKEHIEEAANSKPFTTPVPTLNEGALFFELRSLFLF